MWKYSNNQAYTGIGGSYDYDISVKPFNNPSSNSTYFSDLKAKAINTEVTAVTNVLGTTDPHGWIFETMPTGDKILTEYCDSILPVYTVNVQAHTYKDFCASFYDGTKNFTNFKTAWNTYWISVSKRGDDTSLSISLPQLANWGSGSSGSRISSWSKDTPKYYYDYKLALEKVNDNKRYRYM